MMPDQVNPRHGRFILLTVFVCVAASVLSGYLGGLASLLYSSIIFHEAGHAPPSAILVQRVGIYWGAASGLMAALIWCWFMVRHVPYAGTDRITRRGAWAGVIVGMLATVLLHLGLMLASEEVFLGGPLVGLLFGIPAGAILGAICGAICQVVVRSPGADRALADKADPAEG